jgi:trimethyllysine dioxygenase
VEATTEGLLVHWPKLQASILDEARQHAQAPHQGQSSASSDVAAISDEAHASLYPWSWLYANSYAPRLSIGSNRDDSSNDPVMWGKGIAQQPPTVPYEEIMNMENDRGVARWVNKIAQFGFCFVSGVPATPEDTERLIRRIAFIRETHYGGFWDFTSDLSHGDTAYTNLPLGAHTDTTYFTDPAGLQLFHLLSHTESVKDKTPAQGGASLLVDGFFAAKLLRDVHPEAYRILSSTQISTHSAGDDATLITPLQTSGYPILEHDERSGELIRVRYNNDDRSVLRVREQDVLPFYDALAKWHAILSHADSEYWSQLTPGTALIFDNHRVLHGRSAFTGARRLCGAYVNHDDYRSRLSVLRKQFPDLDTSAGLRRATVAAAVASAAASQNNAADKSAATTAASRLWKRSETKPTPSPSEAQLAKRGVWDDGI